MEKIYGENAVIFWRVLLIYIFLSVPLLPAVAQVVSGVVVVGERGCRKRDKIVLYTNLGFVIAEVYSDSFYKDDQVIGELNSYGFKDVLVNGRSARLYIDDYMLSRDRAAEKCFR
jgi:hypothetical protein